MTARRWWWWKAMSMSSPWSAPDFRPAWPRSAPRSTENQLALLWKMADEPILCFDGDRAGQKAAWRAAELALPQLAARQEPALRAAAGGPGPRRSRALRRARRDRGSDRRGARARRRDLVARNRRRQLTRRRSGARRWRRGSGTHQRHPRRGGAALLSPGSGRAPAADIRAGGRARRLWPAAIIAARRQRIRPPLCAARLVHAGRGGPIRASRRRARRARPAARPSTASPIRWRARSSR